MDELQLLREMRKDVPIAKDAVFAGGRQKLLQRIDPRSKKKIRRRSKALRISLASVAALGLATALVATNVVGLAGWRGGSTAQAAEVLNQAAEMAIKTSDPVVGPGQYLKIDSTELWLTSSVAASQDGKADVNNTVDWLDLEKSSMFVPADRDREWVWERSGRVPTTFFSKEAKEAALSVAGESRYSAELLRGNGGAFYDSISSFPDEEKLASYSRDPRVLLNGIYLTTLNKGQSVDGEALGYIADLLATGIVPADLRAALYKAAAMIPGVTVTENQATLDGQTGVAIGRVEEASDFRQDIIIDTVTGQLIGEREVRTVAMGSIPAGATVGWTTIRSSVVDSAP